jgi:hypothetical protein
MVKTRAGKVVGTQLPYSETSIPIPPPDIISLSIKDFCRISGMGESTAWAMIHRGALETIAIGRRRLILINSYRKLIEEQRAAPPKDARRNGTVPALGSTPGKRNGKSSLDLATPVEDLELSTRATNALLNDGVRTLGDLRGKTDAELLLIPNLGRGSVREIAAALVKRGLREKDGGNAG